MKKIFVVFSLVVNSVAAQNIVLDKIVQGDATAMLQTAFNNKENASVEINAPVLIIDSVLKIPAGKILKIQPGCRLGGHGTISGGIIDAGYQQWIFDTTLTVNPQAVNEYFSAKWFGASGKNGDDRRAIQQSINTCIRNNIRTLFMPVGRYTVSGPLILRGEGKHTNRNFCTLEILGESSFWDSNTGTEIFPSFGNSFVFGIQRGKGCKIRKLRITGKFTPPFTNDKMKFFNTAFDDFTDGKSRDNRYSPYAAIVIDPFTNTANKGPGSTDEYPGLAAYYGTNGSSPESGSTGTELEELNISGFVVGICSAPNSITRNAEITIINKVQFANCKLCISGGQDQEKANSISNIFCWGGTHTIFGTDLYGGKRMAGNWNIDKVNIAGAVVRFIYNDQHGYFASYISHVYAESLATWGTINSELACEIADCNIDFEYPEVAGTQTLLTSWGESVVYRSCNFRYYGQKTPLLFQGNATFEHCYFSGPVQKPAGNGAMIMLPFFKTPFNSDKIIYALSFIAIAIMGIILFKRKTPALAV